VDFADAKGQRNIISELRLPVVAPVSHPATLARGP